MEIPKAIISDADGTLINTMRLIRHGQYETIRAYLTQLGLDDDRIPDYATFENVLHATLGGSAHDTLRRTIQQLYRDDSKLLQTIDYDILHDLLNPIQDEIASEFVRAYTGLSAFLAELGNARIKFAVFTSGTPHHVVRNFGVALPEIGLQELFLDKTRSDRKKLSIFEDRMADHFGLPAFTVVTCEDVTTHKPNPDSLNLAMQRLDVSPAESAVLGDHKVDILSGINANVPMRIGLTHGFGDRASLNEAGATLIINSLTELTEKLKNSS